MRGARASRHECYLFAAASAVVLELLREYTECIHEGIVAAFRILNCHGIR